MDDFDTLSGQQLDKDERDVPFVFNVSIYDGSMHVDRDAVQSKNHVCVSCIAS